MPMRIDLFSCVVLLAAEMLNVIDANTQLFQNHLNYVCVEEILPVHYIQMPKFFCNRNIHYQYARCC